MVFYFDEQNLEQTKQDFEKECPGIGIACLISNNGGIAVRRDSQGVITYYDKEKDEIVELI